MTADDEVVALRAANAALRAENAQVRADLAAARDLSAQVQTRSAELEQRKTPPPAFVKANTEQEARGRARSGTRGTKLGGGARSRLRSCRTRWSGAQTAATSCGGTAARARAR